ncbi:squalene--hopene cyclase [Bacillus songklensis]|uniref:Squalene--hopene cyclase n=1 Tax=Bacillus songklensis TaxID=1069116 RepID=A0ABV8B1U4_9BACI
MAEKVESTINDLVQQFKGYQSVDGAWRYCLENGPVTDAYLIVLLRILEINEEELIRRLVNQLMAKQAENGAWKLFHDEEGNLDATVEAYYALLYSGYIKKDEKRMQEANRFIRENGGISNVKSLLTQILLALTGQIPWPENIEIPIEMILFPKWFPLNIFDLSGHARVHLIPLIIMADKNFSIKSRYTPDISDLYVQNKPFKKSHSPIALLFQSLNFGARSLSFLSDRLHKKALQQAEKFMLDRIEPNGTLLTYSTSTILMIFAFLALGYSKSSDVITNAVQGVKTLVYATNEGPHLQFAASTVWDTALISHAMQQAGVPSTDPVIQKSFSYLLSRQQNKKADWSIHNPNAEPGGWGFSDINTKYPDLDDTVAALRAIKDPASDNISYREAWNRGVNWVLSMQNSDGGWPAFEKNTDKSMLKLIPFEGAKDFVVDSPTPDLNGRVLQFLGKETNLKKDDRQVKKAVKWLIKQQESNGSWFGRWGISYIHGTSAAVIGLVSVGVSRQHPAISRAVKWLLSTQNKDGGWGESCRSDELRKYVPLGYSTPTQTAWALEMLIDTHEKPTAEINRGTECLMESLTKKDWISTYPTGGGLAGIAYFYFHSLNHAWALLTLAKYKQKYIEKRPLSFYSLRR